MNSYKLITSILGLILFISCEQPKENKDIIASFPPNHLDYNIPPKCGENEAYFNKDSEIVLIKEEEFNTIIDRLKSLKPSKESNDCLNDFSFLSEKINIVRVFTTNV